jgi:hypothetical protein
VFVQIVNKKHLFEYVLKKGIEDIVSTLNLFTPSLGNFRLGGRFERAQLANPVSQSRVCFI